MGYVQMALLPSNKTSLEFKFQTSQQYLRHCSLRILQVPNCFQAWISSVLQQICHLSDPPTTTNFGNEIPSSLSFLILRNQDWRDYYNPAQKLKWHSVVRPAGERGISAPQSV